MTTSPFGSARRLTAGERGRLAQWVVLVAAAVTDAERGHAIAAAVAAAQALRQDGVTWGEIASGLGVSVDELRDWRGNHRPGPNSRSLAGPPPPTRASRADRAPSTDGALVVLVVTGDATIKRNDFASEVASIRKALHGRASVVERVNIEIAELRREIDQHRPTIVHLAAHADFGLIHLSLDGAPMAVVAEDVIAAIRRTIHPPAMAMLSCCDSEQLARTLIASRVISEFAVGWRGSLTDEQARTFASLFYHGLHGTTSIAQAFDDAQLTVTARWPDQATPLLFT